MQGKSEWPKHPGSMFGEGKATSLGNQHIVLSVRTAGLPTT